MTETDAQIQADLEPAKFRREREAVEDINLLEEDVPTEPDGDNSVIPGGVEDE